MVFAKEFVAGSITTAQSVVSNDPAIPQNVKSAVIQAIGLSAAPQSPISALYVNVSGQDGETFAVAVRVIPAQF